MYTNNNKRLWELIAKKAAGEASPQELKDLEALAKDFPESLYTMEILEKYWACPSGKTASKALDQSVNALAERIKEDQSSSARYNNLFGVIRMPRAYRSFLAAAAVFFIFCIAGWLYFFNKADVERGVFASMKTLTASKGSKNQFFLPDGSKLWLNAGTTITYRSDFEKDSIREVYLSGEAFFDIRHDEHRPFLIRTDYMDILDIGTSFNVKAYPFDKTAEATLIEGSIEVKMKESGQSKILSTPQQKIIVYRLGERPATADEIRQPDIKHTTSVPFVVTQALPDLPDSLLAETAWMDDMLVFRNESFEELAMKMERWYNVSISFEKEHLKNMRFTGAFDKETVDQALAKLQLMRSFHFTMNDKAIKIDQ
ncbi:MAG: FecR family protein [Chitinophagaceae bacterium]|nr:FecR family protein [Chitinophagaceae bacterium]